MSEAKPVCRIAMPRLPPMLPSRRTFYTNTNTTRHVEAFPLFPFFGVRSSDRLQAI